MAGSLGSRQDRRLVTRRGALVGALACALIVLGLALLVQRPFAPLLSVDQAISDAVHAWALDTPWAVTLSLRLQRIGDVDISTGVALAVTATLLVRRRWWLALAFAATAALAPWITDLLKSTVGRERPVWDVPIETIQDYAFPSGHATGGIAVWAASGVVLASLLRSRHTGAWVALPFVVLGVAMGLSRVVLGVHWPSDVLGGWGVALAVGGLAASLFVLPPSDRDVDLDAGARAASARTPT